MTAEAKIGIDVFKAISRSIAHSEDLDVMTNHLVQVLTGALDIKGCAIFVLNPVSEELEILASFGLSAKYLTKGPLTAPRSIHETFKGKAVIIPRIEEDNSLQYPDEAKKEGIASLVSLPIVFLKDVIGVLRLYHYQPWEICNADLDSLTLLADNIGLAMMYTRYRNTVHAVAEIIGDAFRVELVPKKTIG
jgi:transcriptional regulator with GAF, ATPase, and Fis domain